MTIAQLDGLQINDTMNVILDASLPGGSSVAVTPASTSAKSFNGDGKADILWQNDDGTAAVWLMNGATSRGANVGQSRPRLARSFAAADFNGDGKADILWQNDDGGRRSG